MMDAREVKDEGIQRSRQAGKRSDLSSLYSGEECLHPRALPGRVRRRGEKRETERETSRRVKRKRGE